MLTKAPHHVAANCIRCIHQNKEKSRVYQGMQEQRRQQNQLSEGGMP